MRRVLKWELTLITQVPPGKVLLVGHQDPNISMPTLWIEHSDDQLDPMNYPRDTYQVIGTGHEIDERVNEHVGSCICGAYVWHVYRVKR